MPQINSETWEDTNGIFTHYTGTANSTSQNFTFTTEQHGMAFINKSSFAISLTINGTKNTVPPRSTIQVDDEGFSSFDVKTMTGTGTFELTSYMKKSNGANIDAAEIQSIKSELAQNQKKTDWIDVIEYDHLVVDNDWTQAFLQAINKAITDNLLLRIGHGTFLLDSNTLLFDMPNDSSLRIQGSGENTILKRNNNDVSVDWRVLFKFHAKNGNKVKKIVISDLKVDSNATNNPLPVDRETDYVFEHCADFYFNGDTTVGSWIDYVEFSNVSFTDAVADHVYIAGVSDSGVKTANFNNIFVENRNRVRSDITITGGMEVCNINNFVGTKIEVELNASYANTSLFQLNITNASVSQMLDIAGRGDSTVLQATNVKSNSHTSFTSLRGTISNSTLYFGKGYYGLNRTEYRLNYLNGFRLIACDLYVKPNEGTLTAIPIRVDPEPTRGTRAEFINCNFYLDTTLTSKFDGYLLQTVAWNNTNDKTLSVIKVEKCWFDGRSKTNIYLDRSGYAFLINNDYSGDTNAIFVNGDQTNYGLELTIEGGMFYRLVGKMIRTLGHPNIEFKNVNIDITKGSFDYNNSGYTLSKVKGNRVLYSDVAPTTSNGGFVGDIVQLKAPSAGTVYRWIATVNHPVNGQWKTLTSLGA